MYAEQFRTYTCVYLFECMYVLFAFQKLTSPHSGPESKNIKRERKRERVNAKYGRHTSRVYVCVFVLFLLNLLLFSKARESNRNCASELEKRTRTTTQEFASFSCTQYKIDKMRHYKVTRLRAKGLSRLVGQLILSPQFAAAGNGERAKIAVWECECRECILNGVSPTVFSTLVCLFICLLVVFIVYFINKH